MGAVKSLYVDECVEIETAAYDVWREADYLASAPADMLVESIEWMEEAREFLNDALAKAAKACRDVA